MSAPKDESLEKFYTEVNKGQPTRSVDVEAF